MTLDAPGAVAAPATNTIHEIAPGWALGTPASVPHGDVVMAEFRANTNDASDPPQNNDAANVALCWRIPPPVPGRTDICCERVPAAPTTDAAVRRALAAAMICDQVGDAQRVA